MMKRIFLFLIPVLVLSCSTLDFNPSQRTYTKFAADKLKKPILDTIAVFENENALQALAQDRWQQYSKTLDFSTDSLNGPAYYFSKYVSVAICVNEYAEAIRVVDAYQKAYNNYFNRPNSEGLLEYASLYAQVMDQAEQQGVSPADCIPAVFEAVKEALDPISQWQLYRDLENQTLETYQDAFADAVRKTARITSRNLKGPQIDELLDAYANLKMYEVLFPHTGDLVKAAKAAEYVIDKNVRVPMPDGVELAGISILPRNRDGLVPTVLVINCYPDLISDFSYMQMAASKGFAAVMVYTRGKGGGEGTFVPFENDAEDNYHVIDWVSKQPWSDGQVGMMGGSYLGFTQWAALKKPHPALKTVVPMVSVGIGIDYPMMNNVFIYYMLQWIQYVTNNPYTDLEKFTNRTYWTDLYREHYESGTSFRMLDVLDGVPNAIYQRWLDHPAYDAYWQNMAASSPEEFAAIDIPILSVTGYYDDDQLGALHYYRMHEAHGAPEVVQNHYLLMGPWTHGGAANSQHRVVAGLHLPREGSVDVPDLAYQWFDYIMRDGPKPALLKDRVNLYVMDEGWQHLPDVSAMQDSLKVYPQAMEVGTLGALGEAPVSGTVVLTETFAPNKFDDDNIANTLYADTDFLRTALEDGLVWESAPLTEDRVFSGAPTSQITLTPNVKDADLIVTWYEVTADDQVVRLSIDRERLSFVEDKTTRQLLTPGQPVTLLLKDSFWMGRKIAQGSRLRVMVNVGSSHEYMKNYGSGKPVVDETQADYKPIELTLDLGRTWFSFPLAPSDGT
ncbi:MAG: CocE/NonD family hydrolase [Bacteroidota bacterium]